MSNQSLLITPLLNYAPTNMSVCSVRMQFLSTFIAVVMRTLSFSQRPIAELYRHASAAHSCTYGIVIASATLGQTALPIILTFSSRVPVKT